MLGREHSSQRGRLQLSPLSSHTQEHTVSPLHDKNNQQHSIVLPTSRRLIHVWRTRRTNAVRPEIRAFNCCHRRSSGTNCILKCSYNLYMYDSSSTSYGKQQNYFYRPFPRPAATMPNVYPDQSRHKNNMKNDVQQGREQDMATTTSPCRLRREARQS